MVKWICSTSLVYVTYVSCLKVAGSTLNISTWFMGHCLAWQRVFFEVFSGFLGHLFYIMKVIFYGGYDQVRNFVEGWHILIITTKFF